MIALALIAAALLAWLGWEIATAPHDPAEREDACQHLAYGIVDLPDNMTGARCHFCRRIVRTGPRPAWRDTLTREAQARGEYDPPRPEALRRKGRAS